MPETLPWILFAVATVAALFGLAQWRNLSALLARERQARLESDAGLAALRDDAAKRERRRDDQAAELRELRKRLDKTKRRAFEAQAELEPLAARAASLETELAARERALAERSDALARAEVLANQAGEARDAARAEAQRAISAAEQAPAIPPGPDPQELESLRGEVAALKRRVSESERETARFRQRWRTEQRLYMVIRGELEIAKDRIRALEGLPPREKPYAAPAVQGAPLTRGEGAATDTESELGELN